MSSALLLTAADYNIRPDVICCYVAVSVRRLEESSPPRITDQEQYSIVDSHAGEKADVHGIALLRPLSSDVHYSSIEIETTL